MKTRTRHAIVLAAAGGLILGAAVVCAEEMLTGRIVSIDEHAGTFCVRASATAAQVTITVGPAGLHPWMRTGAHVRVWGDFDGVPARFCARRVSTCGYKGLWHDPTGVRRRLGRGSIRHGTGLYGGQGGAEPGLHHSRGTGRGR